LVNNVNIATSAVTKYRCTYASFAPSLNLILVIALTHEVENHEDNEHHDKAEANQEVILKEY